MCLPLSNTYICYIYVCVTISSTLIASPKHLHVELPTTPTFYPYPINMFLADGTRFFEVLVLIAFSMLLFTAIYLFVDFYVCDTYSCKAFRTSSYKTTAGTADYTLSLLSEVFNDGIWPVPYIGAAILTPLCLWILSVPITILTFSTMFLISFLVIYFMLSFFGHHYIRPITTYVSSCIQDNCPSVPATDCPIGCSSSVQNSKDPICPRDTEVIHDSSSDTTTSHT